MLATILAARICQVDLFQIEHIAAIIFGAFATNVMFLSVPAVETHLRLIGFRYVLTTRW